MSVHDLRQGVRSLRHAPVFWCLATATIALGGVPLPPEPVIVSAGWLAKHASQRNVVVLAIVHSENEYRRGHIPGARFVSYGDITTTRNGLMTELPDAARLRQAFVSAGVTDDSRVLVYSDTPLMASRAFFSLEYLGQRHAAILDGGLKTWQTQGGRVVTDAPFYAKAGSPRMSAPSSSRMQPGSAHTCDRRTSC